MRVCNHNGIILKGGSGHGITTTFHTQCMNTITWLGCGCWSLDSKLCINVGTYIKPTLWITGSYLSPQRRGGTRWRHPWSWAASRGGPPHWTDECSSHCSRTSRWPLQGQRSEFKVIPDETETHILTIHQSSHLRIKTFWAQFLLVNHSCAIISVHPDSSHESGCPPTHT